MSMGRSVSILSCAAQSYRAIVDGMRAQGRWNRTALEGSYLSHLPREAMRALAGFDPKDSKCYYIARDIDPPISLQKEIFPEIERYEGEQSDLRREAQTYSTIGAWELIVSHVVL